MKTEISKLETILPMIPELNLEEIESLMAKLVEAKKVLKPSSYKAGVNIGVGAFIKNLIQTTTLSNKEILVKVVEEYKNENTTTACVAWYRNDLRKKALKTETKTEDKVES